MLDPKNQRRESRKRTVGIVGGGIAGLYTALLLRREGIDFHIIEGTGRVGGRVRTHYFSLEKDQYYESGAMRIPWQSPFHQITFDLIDFLNAAVDNAGIVDKIELINYVLHMKGNEILVNSTHLEPQSVGPETVVPSDIEWDVPAQYRSKTAGELMSHALEPFQKRLKDAIVAGTFEEVFMDIVSEWDIISFRQYLTSFPSMIPGERGYPTPVVDFMETLLSQTNQFSLSVPELLMQTLDFGESKWRTIAGGMSRLPELMAKLIGVDKITYGARVTALRNTSSGKVEVTSTGYNGQVRMHFDQVVLAIPPAALKMLVARPQWSPRKDMAIRSIHFEALYKMGLRFKSRFWEKVENPSRGGQSTTDLPIRWIVFPSNGIGSDGPGVLLIYAWMTDASTWTPLTPIERRSLVLHNLQQVYGKRLEKTYGRGVTVASLLIETSDAVWAAETSTGDASFLPGQFKDRFEAARTPEGNIYFAGEHLSLHHTWISGAADSAVSVVKQLLNKNIKPLHPNDGMTSDIKRAKFHFSFHPNNPLRLDGAVNTPDDRDPENPDMAMLPRTLGEDGVRTIGAAVSNLYSPF